MSNLEQAKALVAKEMNGGAYIENVTDAYRFLAHLQFLLTDGVDGEDRRPCCDYFKVSTARST